jgi:hypothetical protein
LEWITNPVQYDDGLVRVSKAALRDTTSLKTTLQPFYSFGVKDMREAAILLGTIAFAALHLVWYTRAIAWHLWELTGGIRQDGRMTALGTSDWAWTVPVHLPAGLLFYAGAGGPGVVMLLAGSLAAGFAAACLVIDPWCRAQSLLHSWHWRLGLFLTGWFWIPVPSRISLIYQWTVVY